MDDRSGDASALLGMEGFVVLSETEEDGELADGMCGNSPVRGNIRCRGIR